MAVSATTVYPQAPKAWTASIGNSDAAGAWKVLKDNSGNGAGTNGSKITGIVVTSTDTSSRNVQLAIVRSASVTCTSATPGVVTWTGNTMTVGDQFFFTGTAAPTGASLNTPYFVISAGFTAGTSFQFSTSAGGAAVNTSSTGTALVGNMVRVITTVPVAITAGTDGSTAAANMFNTTYYPGVSVDNDGQPYLLQESADFIAVAATAQVTANKIIHVYAQGANF